MQPLKNPFEVGLKNFAYHPHSTDKSTYKSPKPVTSPPKPPKNRFTFRNHRAVKASKTKFV
ncbi:MAG: hypothetical protein LBF15_02105 [Candidatus Peribacteria bacterium]|nr:hypothetical protein [Candidatus Peribacteria bacterium]